MHIPTGTLVMVADGTKMLLLRNDGDVPCPVLNTLAHEEIVNLPTHSQGTDAPGRSQSSMGDRSSALDNVDWHRQTEEHFAAHVAAALDRAATPGDSAIVVIAPPRMLGELRKHYGAGVKHRLQAEITKDLAGHTTDHIIEVIHDWTV